MKNKYGNIFNKLGDDQSLHFFVICSFYRTFRLSEGKGQTEFETLPSERND
jgi:hypothetical protein